MRDDYQYFANDNKMNRAQRKIKLRSMMEEIDNMDIVLKPIYSPYIKISQNGLYDVNRFIDKLEISNCDLPKIPNIDIENSYFENNAFEMRWNIEINNEFEAEIIGFEVYYIKVNMNKLKRIKYYHDDGNFITMQLKYIQNIGISLWNELQKWLPSFLRFFDKGKITEIDEDNDEEIMEFMKNIRSNEWIKGEDIKGFKRKHKIKDLEYNETYLVKLCALNDNGYSEFCKPIMIQTPPLS